jgi:hypothetical protein
MIAKTRSRTSLDTVLLVESGGGGGGRTTSTRGKGGVDDEDDHDGDDDDIVIRYQFSFDANETGNDASVKFVNAVLSSSKGRG